MLNWLLGKSTEVTARVEDEDSEYEPPTTPAPVFAARALKSAIFGTPAPLDNDVTDVVQNELAVASGKVTIAAQPANMSPAKLPGILLTPGTATSKRKTVTFGTEVVDKEEANAGIVNKSGTANQYPGKFPSPWTPKIRSQRKTSLTRTLENSRLGKKKTITSKEPNTQNICDVNSELESVCPESTISGEEPTEPRVTNQSILKDDFDVDVDVTVDLNEPHSSSGKYWKSEYERYHEAAKAEMKNLFRYKQLAKSYAKKKDAEAIDLGEKLKEEQRKVAIMEGRISKLITKIASRGVEDVDNDSPELMKQLAWQSALAVEYRNQVDEFQSTLAATREENNEMRQGHRGSTHPAAAAMGQALGETSMELKKTREQLKDMTSLREETEGLKLALYAADQMTAKLQEENIKLSKELAEMKSTHETCVKECQTLRERLKEEQHKSEGLLLNLQRDYAKLKEQAKAQRREAERLLKKRHDQVAALKQDLAAMREMVVNPPDSEGTAQKNHIASKRNSTSSQHQNIYFEKRDPGVGKSTFSQDERPQSRGQTPKPTTQTGPNNMGKAEMDTNPYLRSMSASEKRKSDIVFQPLHTGLHHLALSEIHNGASDEKDRPRPKSMMLPTLSGTSSSHSLEPPNIYLPTLQPPLASNAPDPLYSMDVSNPRTRLPPEREAAAKARLQEKLAKRRARALGGDKENIGTLI